jgi:hypothetical protein
VSDPGGPVLDVRTYRIVAGGGAEFDRRFREEALPMLQRHGIDVVAYGASLVDEDRYCLIRAFASAARRTEQLDAFYGSDEWLENLDEAVMALIESYHVVVIELSAASREALSAALG